MEAVELIVGVFDSKTRAKEAFFSLKALDKQRLIRLYNAAVLEKDEHGHIHLEEKQDVTPKGGAVFGAITGALIGLLGGPVGMMVGAAAGAATGDIAARMIDLGFSDDFLNDLSDHIKPNHSILMVTIEQQWADQVVASISSYRGKMLRHALREDLADKIANSQTD